MEPQNSKKPQQVGSLKERCLKAIVNNYCQIVSKHDDLEMEIPRSLRKEISSRLYNTIGCRCSSRLPVKVPFNDFIKLFDAQTEELDFNDTMEFNNESCSIFQKFTKVKILCLENIQASSKGLCQMLSKMKKLTVLEMNDCQTFDDTVLKTVAENCVNLYYLNIQNSSITDEGIISLANSSISLDTLDISNTNVTFEGMKKLMTSPTGKTLFDLEFEGTPIMNREEDVISTFLGFKKLSVSTNTELTLEEDYEEYVNWKDAVQEGRKKATEENTRISLKPRRRLT